MSNRLINAVCTVALAFTPGVAAAKTLTFKAALSGATEPTNTASKATGKARIRIDTVRKVVNVELDVTGITKDNLWDQLVAAPIGPIHFHRYGTHNHSGDSARLALPVPYGPSYKATRKGFHVSLRNYDFAQGAKLVGSDADLDAFIAALEAGHVILNVHTDAFNAGEISGAVGKAG